MIKGAWTNGLKPFHCETIQLHSLSFCLKLGFPLILHEPFSFSESPNLKTMSDFYKIT